MSGRRAADQLAVITAADVVDAELVDDETAGAGVVVHTDRDRHQTPPAIVHPNGDQVSIRPIETSYAGHRFRSRLEARWAVFFDTLRISWEYEPQGYVVGPEGSRRPYLPDFWLPREKLWVEVKGTEEQLDVELLVHAAIPHFGLPNPSGPCWVSDHQARLLILGPVGRARVVPDEDTGEHAGYIQPAHTSVT
ncbi:hypothetical protein [Streptomyces bobili]|uniref:hypothetical protein n=1 Tax=Streptomyces bobili TaxID=67280 RepID=UPI00378E7319